MKKSSDHFYGNLPAHEEGSSKYTDQDKYFHELPADWYIIVTTIEQPGDTDHKVHLRNLNLISTGSVVAVLNLAERDGLKVPFFSLEDGTAFLVPKSILDQVLAALSVHQVHVYRNFKIQFRAGAIAVADVLDMGYALKIAKFKGTAQLFIPVIFGNGMDFALEVIKKAIHTLPKTPSQIAGRSFNGLICHWDDIRSTESDDEVVTLVLGITDSIRAKKMRKHVAAIVESIYPGSSFTDEQTWSTEIKKRQSNDSQNWWRSFVLFLQVLYHMIFPARENIPQSASRKQPAQPISERLIMTFYGRSEQRKKLENHLDKLESGGGFLYGLAATSGSILLCYNPKSNRKPIHVIKDGQTGFSIASAMLLDKELQFNKY